MDGRKHEYEDEKPKNQKEDLQMKQFMKKKAFMALFMMVLAALLVMPMAAANAGKGKSRGFNGKGMGLGGMASIVSQLPKEDLSQEELEGILKMVEEEKLARDVYSFLYDQWKAPIFSNIKNSEQRHMDAVISIISKYGLENPVQDLAPGQFATPDMQELYDTLTSEGSQSLEQALQVGATIEDLDIKDLSELIEKCDNQDVLMVFQNLVKGSRNHMRAFTSYLGSLGSTYTAKYLSQDEVDQIVESDWERGPVDSNGQSMKSFKGKRHGLCPCMGN